MKLSKKGKVFHSLRAKMLLWAFVFVLPILLILVSSIRKASNSFDEQTRESINQALTPYTAEIDATLTVAKRYITNLNVDLSIMADAPEDQWMALETIRSLGRSVSEDLAVYPDIDAVFFCSGDNIWFVQNYNRPYAQMRAAAEALKVQLNTYSSDITLFQQGYMYFAAEGRYYLFNAVDVPGGVAGCWFDAEGLVSPILEANPDGLSRVMFSDRQKRMLDPEFDTRSSKQLSERLEPYFVTQRQLSAAPFEINVLWEKDVVFAPIAQMRQSILTTISVAILLFALYVAFLRASLIRPLNRLVSAIHGIRQGNLNQIPIRKNEDVEIANVYQALNAMTDQIESLRIQMYEEKLIKQKAQMQLFQLQLRPHFFLNALNTIISFARVKEYDMVQKMTMYLATHCRYILYSPWFVTVEEELIYTQNFVDMQSAQHDARYRYLVHVEDELLDYEIPILAVQIFVENALKYSNGLERPIEVNVFIEKQALEDARNLRILVSDTGDGFSEAALAMLNNLEILQPSDADHGIGIANIRQRLKILYGDRATIRFSNRKAGGAHVEMILPIDRKEGEDR